MRKIVTLILLTLSVFGTGLAEEDNFKVTKSEAEWRKELTPEQYQVLRGQGTERPFTSQCLHIKENGRLRQPSFYLRSEV